MSAAAELRLKSNPFPGLRPYEESDSELFFGREDQIRDVLGRLRNLRFLSVLGNSGCGKSSLVRAGIIPVLRDGFMADRPDGWRIVVMRPGSEPLANLVRALDASDPVNPDQPSSDLKSSLMLNTLSHSDFGLVDVLAQAKIPPHTNILVLVDQFEELFRLRDEAAQNKATEEATRFVQLLLTAAGQHDLPIYVVLTMRSEFLGDCTPFSGLPEAINDGLYLVPRLSREQLRDAIEQPIKLAGGSITNRLVNRLLNDLGEEQDLLPVLQHALMRLWSLSQLEAQGQPPKLDIGLYESSRIEGIQLALSRHIEEILREELDQRQARQAEILFRNLTTISDNGEFVREPTELGVIASLANVSSEAMAEVVDRFRGEGKSFLMPPAPEPLTATTKIDISHESLIRQWAQLRQWTLAEAPARRIRKNLVEEAELWDSQTVSQDRINCLLRGPHLQEALNWQSAHIEELKQPSMALAAEFLEASIRRRNAERRWQKLKQRGAVFVAFASLSVAFVMLNLRRKSVIAESRANWISRSANLERAWRKWKDFEPVEAWGYLRLASAGQASDWACNVMEHVFRGPSHSFDVRGTITDVSWNPIEKQLAVAAASPGKDKAGSLFIFPARASGLLKDSKPRAIETPSDVGCLVWLNSPDHPSLIIGGDNEGKLVAWRTDTKENVSTGRIDPKAGSASGELRVTCLATSPTEDKVLAGYSDGRVLLWDVEWKDSTSVILSSQELYSEGNVEVNSIAFDPKGRYALIAARKEIDNDEDDLPLSRLYAWDLVEKKKVSNATLVAISKAGVLKFTINAQYLMATTGAGAMRTSIQVWNLETLDKGETATSEVATPLELNGHSGEIRCLKFTTTGDLVSTGNDGTIRVWSLGDPTKVSQPQVLMRHSDQVYALAIMDIRSRIQIASGGFDKQLRVGALLSASSESESEVSDQVKSVAMSGDGKWIIQGLRNEKTPLLVSVDQPNKAVLPEATRVDRTQDVLCVAIGGENENIVVAGVRDGTIGLYKRVSGKLELFYEFLSPGKKPVYSVALDPRGRFLLCSLANGEAFVYSLFDVLNKTQREQKILPCSEPSSKNEFGSRLDDSTAVYTMCFNQDGSKLLTGHRNGSIWMWEFNGSELSNLKYIGCYLPQTPVYSLAFSPSEDCVVSANLKGRFCVWGIPDQSIFDHNRTLYEIYDDISIKPLIEFIDQHLESIGVAVNQGNSAQMANGFLYSFTSDGMRHDVVKQFSGESRLQVEPTESP